MKNKHSMPSLKNRLIGLQLEANTAYVMPPRSNVSTEALSINNLVTGTVHKLARFLTDVSMSIELKTLAAIDSYANTNLKDKRVIEKIRSGLEAINYMDIKDQRFPIIPGLDTTWLKFLVELKTNVEIARDLYENFLLPFKVFLGSAINNPESLSSSTISRDINPFDFDKHNKALGATLKGNPRIPVAKWGSLVDRNSDYNIVLTETDLLIKQIEINNPDLIRKETEEIKKLLDTLSKQITDPNLAYRLSKRAILALSDATFNLAQGVEFYGVTYTTLLSHSKSLEEVNKKLLKLI